MTMRRAFLGAGAGAAAHGLGLRLAHGLPRTLKALAIDGFVVFDPASPS